MEDFQERNFMEGMQIGPKMSERGLEQLADLLAEKVTEKLAEKNSSCQLTPSEQQAVKDLLKTKKNAVRAFIWISGALVLWIIKDVYAYIIGHLTLK